jgi:hypothetical protein
MKTLWYGFYLDQLTRPIVFLLRVAAALALLAGSLSFVALAIFLFMVIFGAMPHTGPGGFMGPGGP